MSLASESSTSTPWWRPLGRSDRQALWLLFVIPVALFVVPALWGHPAIDADNLIQNFPLRVLAGRQIASGHLPLLNPLTNAGTPLLGGMNAGAFYPLSLIFAFVPAITAWLINMIAVYLCAAVGVFSLLRWHGLRSWPSFAAGLSYTYSGALIGQMVHLGVVQGYSFVPWAVLVMLALSKRLRQVEEEASWLELARVALPWACGVALLWGLVFLTGEPRAIAVIELLTIVVVPCVLFLRTSYWLRSWRARVAYSITLLIGFLWGVGLGLAQLLPAWSFISFSQRSQVSYSFFGAGSLSVRWSALLLSPDIFGGNGSLGQRSFFANYNLPEVTGYAGVLALMAAAAFVTRLTWRGWRGEERDFVIYVAVGVVGLFATWGSFTKLGYLFRAIPLYGSTRLQSRNVILVDFALSIVLGWWLQHVGDAKRERAGLGRWSSLITSIPAAIVAVLSLALLGWGPWVVAHLGVPAGVPQLATGLTLVNALHLAVALGALFVVWCWRHSRHLPRLLFIVLVVDLVVFVAFTATGLIGGPGPREASRATAVSLLGTKGRFAFVDQSGLHTGVFRDLGLPNMNVFTGLSSVQGYGALISTFYDNATGTHPQATLNPCRLADGTFVQLRLSAIAISSAVLSTKTGSGISADTNCVTVKPEPSVHRYFGQLLKVHTIILTGEHGEPLSRDSLHLQLLNGDGQPIGRTITAVNETDSKAVFVEREPVLSAGFIVSSRLGVAIGHAVVASYGSNQSYLLDTKFQLALASPSWRLTSTQDRFSVFKAASVLPAAWLDAPANGQLTKIRDSTWGDSWINVRLSRSSVLEQSEAFLPGWRATARNVSSGRVVNLIVHRAGLIQSVRVPKGRWTIHFHYDAPYSDVGLVASVASSLLFVAVVLTLGLRGRRKGNAKVHS